MYRNPPIQLYETDLGVNLAGRSRHTAVSGVELISLTGRTLSSVHVNIDLITLVNNSVQCGGSTRLCSKSSAHGHTLKRPRRFVDGWGSSVSESYTLLDTPVEVNTQTISEMSDDSRQKRREPNMYCLDQ